MCKNTMVLTCGGGGGARMKNSAMKVRNEALSKAVCGASSLLLLSGLPF